MVQSIGMGIGIPFSHQGFNPFSIGQPIALFDAAVGITLNGADVSGWTDQSGHGNDLAQATELDQPLFTASNANFNSNPSVDGDGVDHWINRATWTQGAQAQPTTTFFVHRLVTTAGAERLFDGGTAGARQTLTNTTAQASMSSITAQDIHTNDTSAHVLALLWNAASSNSWLDGIETTPAASPGTQGLNGIALFASITGTIPADLEIAYFLAYASNLSAAEKNYIGNGLAARFGTTWTNI